jgi:hypothetical protein
MQRAIKYSVDDLLTDADRCFLWYRSIGPIMAKLGLSLADTR